MVFGLGNNITYGSVIIKPFLLMEILIESFKYGIAPAFIILIYLIITRYFDHKKDIEKLKVEQEEHKKSIKVNAELVDCFNQLNSYLKYVTIDIVEVDKDKAIAAIRSSFRSMNFGLSRFATFTIVNNNIEENRSGIIDNIKDTIEAEYLSLYNELTLYRDEDTRVSEYLDPLWKDELIKIMIDCIFNTRLTKEQRIYNIHNRLGIDITNYSNIVHNKFVNN